MMLNEGAMELGEVLVDVPLKFCKGEVLNALGMGCALVLPLAQDLPIDLI